MKRLLIIGWFFCAVAVVFAGQRNYDVEYSYIESVRNREMGNLNASVYILGSILRVDSACAVCYYDLSRIYRATGSLAQAMTFAAKAYAQDAENYWYLRNYVDLLLASGDTVKALQHALQLLRMPEADFDDMLMFATLAINFPEYRGEGKAVLSRFGIASGLPEVLHLHFLYRKADRVPFAILDKFLDSCIVAYPEVPVFYLDRAVLYAENKKFNASRRLFMNILRSDSFSFEAIYEYSRFFSWRSDVRLIFAYLDSFFNFSVENDSRLVWLERMLRSGQPTLMSYLDERLVEFANKYTFPESFFDEAFNFYWGRNRMERLLLLGMRFVQLYPDNVSAWGRYLLPLYILERYHAIDSILSVNPGAFTSPFAMYVAGMMYYRRGDHVRSRDYLIGSLKVAGNFGYKPIAVNLVADYYYRKGMRDSAFYYYEMAIQNDFADETIMNNYAYYLALAGRSLNRAEMLARAAVMKYPKNSAFLDTYAWVLYRLRRYPEALKYMEKALKYMGREDRRELLEHYAVILYCNGSKKKADKLMRELFPDEIKRAEFFKSTILCDE